jgi:hypothetical protein
VVDNTASRVRVAIANITPGFVEVERDVPAVDIARITLACALALA